MQGRVCRFRTCRCEWAFVLSLSRFWLPRTARRETDAGRAGGRPFLWHLSELASIGPTGAFVRSCHRLTPPVSSSTEAPPRLPRAPGRRWHMRAPRLASLQAQGRDVKSSADSYLTLFPRKKVPVVSVICSHAQVNELVAGAGLTLTFSVGFVAWALVDFCRTGL